MMQTRKLGKNGPDLTVIGLGTWAIGGPWQFGWGPQGDDNSIKAIQAGIDSGINWIDTAAVYGLGHSEEVVARAVKDRRDKVFIATKCGQVWDKNGKTKKNNKPENIRREIEDSLRRLNTDYIDLYQIHWPDSETPIEDSWGTMARLQEEGKTRYIGVSNYRLNQLKECEAIHHINSLQPPYSLLNRKVEREILSWCRESGVGVIAYSPMQSGLLTGKFNNSKKSELAEDDWRQNSPYFNEPQFSKNLEFVDALRPIAAKYGKQLNHLAIAWVLMNPAVTAAIVGVRSTGQLEDNLGGAGWKIEAEDMAKIEDLRRQILE
jgi:aryl-alcohol dehydrogenase-like predicted oxidoreductase